LAGWNVLGYEYAASRHADYTPGSPDLDRLVQIMTALTAISVPNAHAGKVPDWRHAGGAVRNAVARLERLGAERDDSPVKIFRSSAW
jgi:hypothetical protein